MPGALYTVSATALHLRADAGIEAKVVAILAKGTQVALVTESDVPGWWQVDVPGRGLSGFVARQYLTAQSSSAWRPEEIVNEILWDRTEACAGKVAYLLGARHSVSGKIDCSGWVGEITAAGFDAVNQAAAPDVVFHRADYRLLDTHSDGIICGIENRTGFALHGADVTLDALKPGMLIGCNFADYAWEKDSPPRVYGIDHIVEVMRHPETGELKITQSSHSGGGVNAQPLADWYADRKRAGMITGGKLHAVDPLLLADRNTDFARTPPPAADQASASPASLGAPPAPASLFAGRGFYIYTAAQLVAELGSIGVAVAELKRCKADAIWVRIHGRGYVGESKTGPTELLDRLIAQARGAGIKVVGWGWCQGEDAAADAALADQAIGRFGVDGYAADIEQGVNGAHWTQAGVDSFIATLRGKYPSFPLVLTSHGFIDWHDPALFANAAQHFDCVNPQAYWGNTNPRQAMLDDAGVTETQYPLREPASYARLCAKVWQDRFERPVVIAGEIAPEDGFDRDDVLAKLESFLANYQRPNGVIGEVYWHFGAATRAMRDLLATS